jgi:hypothetical protein
MTEIQIGDELHFTLKGLPGVYRGKVAFFDVIGRPVVEATHGRPVDTKTWYPTTAPVRGYYRPHEYRLEILREPTT